MPRRTTAIAAALSLLALGSSLVIANANPLTTQYFNQGVEKYEVGNYQGAIADYDKVIEINPKLADAYRMRGVNKELIGDLKGACSDWRKAADFGLTEPAKWVKKQC